MSTAFSCYREIQIMFADMLLTCEKFSNIVESLLYVECYGVGEGPGPAFMPQHSVTVAFHKKSEWRVVGGGWLQPGSR